MRNEPERLLGESPAMLRVLEEVSQVAPLEKPVLIVGERGTGKELIAARLHYLSNRWEGSFVKMNCAAISESLLESELFGHEAGAFTGATRTHQGRFERADGGTLFLDELATTSPLVQEKLLGGCFTVSMLTGLEVTRFTALQNQFQSAVLAVGSPRERVVREPDGTFAAVRFVTLTLSYDHGVCEGFYAGQFLTRLKQALEDPGTVAS